MISLLKIGILDDRVLFDINSVTFNLLLRTLNQLMDKMTIVVMSYSGGRKWVVDNFIRYMVFEQVHNDKLRYSSSKRKSRGVNYKLIRFFRLCDIFFDFFYEIKIFYKCFDMWSILLFIVKNILFIFNLSVLILKVNKMTLRFRIPGIFVDVD